LLQRWYFKPLAVFLALSLSIQTALAAASCNDLYPPLGTTNSAGGGGTSGGSSTGPIVNPNAPPGACPVSGVTRPTDAAAQAIFAGQNVGMAPFAPSIVASGSAVNMDGLDSSMRQKMMCMRDEAARDGGTISVSSCYRPQSYQNYLRDIWLRNDLFNRPEGQSYGAECDAVRIQVRNLFASHGLLPTQPPALVSKHSQGLAIDMSYSKGYGVLDQLAARCGLRRPFLPQDPPHYE